MMTSDDREQGSGETAPPSDPWVPPEEPQQEGAAEEGSTITAAPPERARWPWVVGGGVLLLLVLGGVIVAGLGGPARDEAGRITEAGEVTAFDLAVGDCVQDPLGVEEDGEEVFRLDAVPCTEPHDAEVYAVFEHPSGQDEDYLGEETVVDYADQGCLDRFEDYVGSPYIDSRYYFATLYPTDASWSRGDREFVCLATAPEGEQITGSIAGSGG